MSRFVDAIITYRILKKLSTPFDETDAYKLGIIDAKGNVLKKFNTLTSPEERDAYTLLDRLIWRMKKIVGAVPHEKSKILSMAAAFALVREHLEAGVEPLPSRFESRMLNLHEENLIAEVALVEQFLNTRIKTFGMHLEDMGMTAVMNSVGDGFSTQATANPNPSLAGKDLGLGKKKLQRRKNPNYAK
jgi:hypothetical protein